MILLRNRSKLSTSLATHVNENTHPANSSNNNNHDTLKLNQHGSRILLCTPSNSAVDEVMDRLCSENAVLDKNNHPMTFKCVRVGAGSTESKYDLDKLSDEHSKNNRLDARNVRHNVLERIKAIKDDLNRVMEHISNVSKLYHSTDGNQVARNGEMNGKGSDGTIDYLKLKADLSDLYDKKRDLQAQLQSHKERLDAQQKQLKESQEKARLEILESADVVCTTLSGSGMDTFTQLKRAFDYVVVDEAAQALEISTLIPLKYKCKTCILVGDTQQLSATMISRVAAEYAYNQSLFQRLQRNGIPVTMLNVQYRMNPEIRKWPSMYFYHNRLQDGLNVQNDESQTFFNSRCPDKELHDLRASPYLLYDVSYGAESKDKTSTKNITEAQFAAQLLIFMHRYMSQMRRSSSSSSESLNKALDGDVEMVDANNITSDFASRVGIITPYRQQAYEIRRQLHTMNRQYGNPSLIVQNIEINTVDSFQVSNQCLALVLCCLDIIYACSYIVYILMLTNSMCRVVLCCAVLYCVLTKGREKDFIIFSAVRANDSTTQRGSRSIGFLSEASRLNVALTRARLALFVLGHFKTLTSDATWRSLYDDAYHRGLVVNVPKKYERVFERPSGREVALLRYVDSTTGGNTADNEKSTVYTIPPPLRVDIEQSSFYPHRHIAHRGVRESESFETLANQVMREAGEIDDEGDVIMGNDNNHGSNTDSATNESKTSISNGVTASNKRTDDVMHQPSNSNSNKNSDVGVVKPVSKPVAPRMRTSNAAITKKVQLDEMSRVDGSDTDSDSSPDSHDDIPLDRLSGKQQATKAAPSLSVPSKPSFAPTSVKRKTSPADAIKASPRNAATSTKKTSADSKLSAATTKKKQTAASAAIHTGKRSAIPKPVPDQTTQPLKKRAPPSASSSTLRSAKK